MPKAIMRDPTPAWLKPGAASVTDSDTTKVLRALAGLIGADDPQSQVMGVMTSGTPAGEGGVLGLVKKAIKAYHGSPHDFDKFSLDKIGTGEGAQAYGHGMYFAESPETAKTYRDALKWRGSNWDDPQVIAGRVLEEHGGNIQAAVQQLEDANRRNVGFKASEAGNVKRQQAIDLLKAGGQVKGSENPGRMYEVAINADPEQFLDWDAPLSNQPQIAERLRQEIEAIKKWRIGQASKWGTPSAQDLASYSAQADEQIGRMTGEQILRELPSVIGDLRGGQDVAVSRALKERGMPGLKYLDQGSRTVGEGTRNYVVFDDALIEILKKWGLLPGAVAGGYASNQSQ